MRAGSTVGLFLDEESRLHLYIDGIDQGVVASDIPPYVYAVLDVYGQCEQISIVGPTGEPPNELQNNAVAAAMERLTIESDDVENSREKADLECHEKESGNQDGASLIDELSDPLVSMPAVVAEQSNETEETEETKATMSARNNDRASRNSLPNTKGM